MRSLEEYAVECAVNKVFASEVLNYVVDENVQILWRFLRFDRERCICRGDAKLPSKGHEDS